MRPTIPLDAWRIAVDLDGTRAIRDVPERHTRGCPCALCRNWARVRDVVLPAELQAQMRRVGIEPDDPTDMSGADRRPGTVGLHIIYHCVGRVISGPPVWARDEQWGAVRNYRVLREDPHLAMMVTAPGPHDVTPEWATERMRPLLIVDFRLDAPWMLDAPLFEPPRPRYKPRRDLPGRRGLRRLQARFRRYLAEDADLR